MAWRIEYSTVALRFLSKIEKQLAKRLLKKLEDASGDPHRYFTRLVGQDDYKMRVGDYRIFALLLDSEKKIYVETIGHRKNVYEKRF
ncbi:type II toxin-antitoxin system RelE/ParE family toxin [Candidatus Micrarchaeota archaeon]|nr:type II toxin-antitoxin system RelE/ParE family toxin [Candidatus Micrarchaeota archaeon]